MALKLPRLQARTQITEGSGLPALSFHQWWDKFAKSIEDAFNHLDATVAAIAAAQAAANAANAAAAAANAAAGDAAAQAAITNSGVTGVTITGSDAGSNATASITAHTRVYGNGTSVSVNSGSVTGLAYSTLYYIYYDQPSRAGGAVTYQATTSQATAAQTGNRHLVGSVTTPAALAGNTGGNYVGAPGLGSIV